MGLTAICLSTACLLWGKQVTETVKTEHTKFLDEKEKYSGPDESVDQDKLLPWDFADSRLRGTSEEAKDRVLRLSQDERT